MINDTHNVSLGPGISFEVFGHNFLFAENLHSVQFFSRISFSMAQKDLSKGSFTQHLMKDKVLCSHTCGVDSGMFNSIDWDLL